MFKRLAATAIVFTSALALTGCTPPMPPEVRTALLEQNIICETGEATMWVDPNLATWVDNLQFSLQTDCPDASVSLADSYDSADIVVSASAPGADSGLISAPIAVQAAALAINSYDIGAVAISAQALADIFSGKITNWSDPVLVAENPAEILPDLPISIYPEGDAAAVAAVQSWLDATLGTQPAIPVTGVEDFDYSLVLDSEDGSLAVVTGVQNFELGLVQASLWFGDADDQKAPADQNSLNAGASQLKFKTPNDKTVTAALSYDAKVAKAAGRNTAVAPYQLVFPIYVTLTDPEPSNIVKFVASYALRGNSQAELELIGLTALPETLRIQSKTTVSQGLPEPEFTAEQLKEFGLTE